MKYEDLDKICHSLDGKNAIDMMAKGAGQGNFELRWLNKGYAGDPQWYICFDSTPKIEWKCILYFASESTN